MRPTSRAVVALIVIWLVPRASNARHVEPGEWWLTGAVGADAKLPSPLGGSAGHFQLAGQVEHTLGKNLSFLADVALGLADSVALHAHAGVKARVTGLALPLSPYGVLQFSGGRLFDVIGANLTVIGARAGVGADYFLTSRLGGGLLINTDLGTTLGQRPAFYGTLGALAYGSYRL